MSNSEHEWKFTDRPIPRETAPVHSTLIRPEVFLDGNAWCALFGTDIQSGIAAFGDTPEEATANFYAELRKVRPCSVAPAVGKTLPKD